MKRHVNNLIIGQGLAGTTLAWRLLATGQSMVLVDRQETATASRVSAGLITPWTGRRMTQSDDYEEKWIEAKKFYRMIEKRLVEPLFTEQSMVRLFVSRSDEAIGQQRMMESPCGALHRWSGRLQSHGLVIQGGRMSPAGRLDVQRYLQASSDFFSDRGLWYQLDLNLSDELIVQDNQVRIPELELSADRVIFCQGAARNPWFEEIPNNPSRGDVIRVQLDNYQMKEVVHHSIWLAPEPDGTLTAGATYDWSLIKNTSTAAGRREILNAMSRFIEGPIHVRHQAGAVRPTMKDYRPVIGQHDTFKRLWIFNGLGSRGVLLAPGLAQQLVELFTDERKHQTNQFSPDRLKPREKHRPLTEIAQTRISKAIQPGQVVIDATVGNGFDTSFLAKKVGEHGLVYGFDVQAQAIESTRKRLEVGRCRNVKLLQQSHSYIQRHISGSVSAAMFNLGYLPRGDHSITTRPDTTVAALEQTADRLVSGGMITILAYRGHDGGSEEAAAVEKWLQEQGDCTIERIDSQPMKISSPVLFILTKVDKPA